MTEPLLRLRDVAETIVSGYLFRVVTYMDELYEGARPKSAHFKAVLARQNFELESNQVAGMVTFKILLRLENPLPGLNALVHKQATETPGSVVILPMLELVSIVAKSDLEEAGWHEIPIPSIRPERQLVS